jgi:hypothetical protein
MKKGLFRPIYPLKGIIPSAKAAFILFPKTAYQNTFLFYLFAG